MKKIKFLWIDDKKIKVDHYKTVIEGWGDNSTISASVDFLEVKADLLQKLESLVNTVKAAPRKRPHLIIIDHFFNINLPFGLQGATVAHLLRNELPNVPMVCVTAVSPVKQPGALAQGDVAEYSAVFPYSDLENHIEDLYAIARDFPKLLSGATTDPSTTSDQILKVVRPPPQDKIQLQLILPEEFQYTKDASTPHYAARWLLKHFLQRPGLLYDRLYAATFLGLTKGGFSKIENLFSGAVYKGVFANESNPRWWVSSLRNILFELVGEDGPDVTQIAGRTLPGIEQADFSKCAVSRSSQPPPDVVVRADATLDAEFKVVRHEFSAQHPGDSGSTPGFETQLVLQRANAS
jgi:hypothetical protein